ncbi:hypothetical protein [Labilibaculum manganireducens]|uniref:hypothetical protein n=1 Tax=Labilibaculum manganireducens TaxID=1940525 RepID=UPI0029F494A5|nr:hypothetical protein [Labilibaculum manganireducens]
MVRDLFKQFTGFLFAFFLLFSTQVSAQLVNVISTSAEDELIKKYNFFSMVEVESDIAVGQECVKVKNISDLPLLFFKEAMFTPNRAIEVHFMDANSENMVLEHNKSEDDIFFVKCRFVVGEYSKSWFVLLDDHAVVLENCATHKYLGLTEKGDFYPVNEVRDASRFELIHHF